MRDQPEKHGEDQRDHGQGRHSMDCLSMSRSLGAGRESPRHTLGAPLGLFRPADRPSGGRRSGRREPLPNDCSKDCWLGSSQPIPPSPAAHCSHHPCGTAIQSARFARSLYSERHYPAVPHVCMCGRSRTRTLSRCYLAVGEQIPATLASESRLRPIGLRWIPFYSSRAWSRAWSN